MINGTEAARVSLEGLSVGDAFGEMCFALPISDIRERRLPPAPWRWTDDTHMALSVVEILARYGHVEQNALAQAFAVSPSSLFAVMAWVLRDRSLVSTPAAIGAKRRLRSSEVALLATAAPCGRRRCARDTLRAVHEARLAAQITHSHVDGQAGAMAVAAAASLLAAGDAHDAGELLLTVARLLPVCATRAGIEHACDIHYADHARAVRELGTGKGLPAQDTVPFCLWCAFHNRTDVRAALWHTVAGLGDRDSTYAIVGGVVALSAGGVPVEWIERREPLPAVFLP
jgi:ADP-ribosylglycohydrolase